MTVQLALPKDVEGRLLAEVNAGRHASLEEAILERLSRNEEPHLLAATDMHPDGLRRDLDDAWNNRGDAVDGEEVFRRLANRGRSQSDQSYSASFHVTRDR